MNSCWLYDLIALEKLLLPEHGGGRLRDVPVSADEPQLRAGLHESLVRSFDFRPGL